MNAIQALSQVSYSPKQFTYATFYPHTALPQACAEPPRSIILSKDGTIVNNQLRARGVFVFLALDGYNGQQKHIGACACVRGGKGVFLS